MTVRPVAVVTGASRGIGAATARQLAHRGADLVLAARSPRGLADTAEAATQAGARVLPVTTDLAGDAAATDVVERTLEHFGRLDVLVNNAASLGPIAPLGTVDRDPLVTTLALNLLAPLGLVRAAAPALRAAGGRVLNLSSTAATQPMAGLGTYGLTKAALAAATRVLALEEPGITWLLVQPGPVDTDMHVALREDGEGIDPERRSYYHELNEQGGLAAPDQVGARIAWLALHAPAGWNGREIGVDDPELSQLIDERSAQP